MSTLSLRRETLGELGAAELAAIAGGTGSGGCVTVLPTFVCVSVDDCVPGRYTSTMVC